MILLTLFGRPDLSIDGARIRGLRSRKAIHLLAVLAVDGPSSRKAAAAVVWPHLPEAQGRSELARIVHDLRLRAGPVLISVASDALWLDSRFLDDDVTALSSAERSADPALWEAALARCEGEFLAGLNDPDTGNAWIERTRRALADRLAALRARLARHERAFGRSLAAGQPRLPAPLGPLIGRDALVDSVTNRLLESGTPLLLNLIGLAGVGKSRVAAQVATRVRAAPTRFELVALADLATVSSADAVVEAVTRALGDIPGARPWQALHRRLDGTASLLVLDNVDRVGELWSWCRDLLDDFPRLALLTTSRRRLGLVGEVVVPVRGLTPADAAALLAHVLAREGVASVPDTRQLTRSGARLDGLPLAIELAAIAVARGGDLDPDRVVEEVLHSRAREHDRPRRQRTLRRAVDSSYVLASPAARHAFAALTLCAGPSDVAVVAAVSGRPEAATRAALGELLELGLVHRLPERPTRFDLPAVIVPLARAYLVHRREQPPAQRAPGD